MKTNGAGILALVMAVAGMPAWAQGHRNDNPNLRQFYMARQQIQITDDAPAVNDMRTGASAGGGAPNAPQGLPRAGFGSNMSGLYNGASMKGGLPEVMNGVPKAPPPPSPAAMKARAGKMRTAAAPKAKAPSGPVAVKAYSPYKTYGTSGGSGASTMSSSGNVRGSVLHWNRKRTGY